MGSKDGGVDVPKPVDSFGLERNGLEIWQKSRLEKILRVPFNGVIADVFGDNDRKLGIYGGAAVMATTEVIEPATIGLGWDFDDLRSGQLADVDWMMDFEGQQAEELAERLRERMEEGFGVEVGGSGGYQTIEVRRLRDGVVVASIADLVKSAGFVGEIRKSLGQNIDGVPDWEMYVGGSLFNTWSALVLNDGVWQNLTFADKKGSLMEINPETVVNMNTYYRLVDNHNTVLASETPREFLGWMSRAVGLWSYGVGFGVGPEDLLKLRDELGEFRRLTNNFEGERYIVARAVLAERIVRGIAFDFDGMRMGLINSGLMAVLSPTLNESLEKLNLPANNLVFHKTRDLLVKAGNEGRMNDVNNFLVLLAVGVGLDEEEFEEMIGELELSWKPRDLASTAVWKGKKLDVDTVDFDRLRKMGELLDGLLVERWRRAGRGELGEDARLLAVFRTVMIE